MPANSPVRSAAGGGAVSSAGGGTTVAGDDDAAAGIFLQDAPLVLDLGCGNGVFLAGLAAQEPGWNVVGLEKKFYRVRQARRRAGRFPNAQVVQGDVLEVLGDLPPASVARVYLLFSDPWPKRRHAGRRLVQPGFLALLRSRLEAEGIFFFASDSVEYAAWARGLFTQAGWRVQEWVVSGGWPRTEFEERFRAEGLAVHRFQAARP